MKYAILDQLRASQEHANGSGFNSRVRALATSLPAVPLNPRAAQPRSSVRSAMIENTLTEVFCLRGPDQQPEWHVMVDGYLVPTEFNSKGAAEAAIPVERARIARRHAKTSGGGHERMAHKRASHGM